MRRTRRKWLVGGAILALALSYLAYAGVRAGQSYYMHVDDFLADGTATRQPVRLHGRVSPDQFHLDAGGLRASFVLEGQTARLPVTYEGPIPDTFQTGREVVVSGRMGEDGVFRAGELLTKCASKYAPAQGASP